jgi:hypothetical protein
MNPEVLHDSLLLESGYAVAVGGIEWPTTNDLADRSLVVSCPLFTQPPQFDGSFMLSRSFSDSTFPSANIMVGDHDAAGLCPRNATSTQCTSSLTSDLLLLWQRHRQQAALQDQITYQYNHQQRVGPGLSFVPASNSVGLDVWSMAVPSTTTSLMIDRFQPESLQGNKDSSASYIQQPPLSPPVLATSMAGQHFKPILRALSPYNFFFRDERNRIVENNSQGPYDTSAEKKRALLAHHWHRDRSKKRRHRKTHGKIAFTELSNVVSRRWKELPNSTKDFYRNVAADDMVRYRKEIAAQNARLRSLNRTTEF